MSRAVVLFLAKVEQVNMLVRQDTVADSSWWPASSSRDVRGVLAKAVIVGLRVRGTSATAGGTDTLSNVPPFISDEFLVRELSRHGKVVSPIRKMLSGCKSPLLRHVVSHRRQVHMILNNRAEEFNYRFIVRVDDFDYTLFATSSALKCFNCNEEGHLARACPSRVASDAQAAEPAAPAPVAPPAPRPVPAARRRWLSAEGSSAAPDGATAESQMEEKRDECVRESEMSGESEIVEMVVEMNGESGESGGKVDLTGEVCDLSGVMSEVVSRAGTAAGKQGGGEGGIVEQGEGARRNKRKSAMKDKGGKTGRLEETATDTDTSDCESMSDGSKLSATMPEGQEIDLYPPGLFKKFLTQTKGMKGLDLGTYFPDRLCFIRDCGIEADWEKEWEGQVLLSHNTTLSGGVGLLFSRGFTLSSLEVEHVWWDRGKVELQLLCQQYTLNATQDTRRSIKDLEMEIVELEAIGSSTGDRGCIETLQSKKMALASLLDSQVQGALVRSWIQDITEMDAPSSFFFGLEKKRGQNLIIHSLLSSTGQELVEPGQIRQRAVEFFSSLYESEYRRDNDLFHEFCGDLPRVSEEANSQLDRPLKLDELHAALLSMKGRKSSGVDGLAVEFFKAYWDIVAHDMLEGNLQEIRNWRPVSLLCVDYRILSKTLASRLREAMEQVIHRDQTYCVPGRVNWHKSEALAVGRWEIVCRSFPRILPGEGTVLNRRGLSNRSTSVWADRLGGDGACPCWRVLYKPPLKKRTGDLQWRILHGAVALNALLLKINNAVSDRHHHYYGINISRNHLSNTNNPPYFSEQRFVSSLLFSSEATTTTPAT
ncbi:Transposon TX1 uncharacterized 149 kDa protein ORF 2, partial [Takifugu flavidus]